MPHRFTCILCLLLMVTNIIIGCENKKETDYLINYNNKLSGLSELSVISKLAEATSRHVEDFEMVNSKTHNTNQFIVFNKNTSDIEVMDFVICTKTGEEKKYYNLNHSPEGLTFYDTKFNQEQDSTNTIKLVDFFRILNKINYSKIIDISEKDKNALTVYFSKEFLVMASDIKLSTEYPKFICKNDGQLEKLVTENNFDNSKKYLKLVVKNALIYSALDSRTPETPGGSSTDGKTLTEIYVEI